MDVEFVHAITMKSLPLHNFTNIFHRKWLLGHFFLLLFKCLQLNEFSLFVLFLFFSLFLPFSPFLFFWHAFSHSLSHTFSLSSLLFLTFTISGRRPLFLSSVVSHYIPHTNCTKSHSHHRHSQKYRIDRFGKKKIHINFRSFFSLFLSMKLKTLDVSTNST